LSDGWKKEIYQYIWFFRGALQVLTDLDFADDVALLVEMLEVFVLAMTVMQEDLIDHL